MKKINILEVNNIDLPGKRFNGYDLINYADNSKYDIYQIVNDKKSNNDRVVELFNIKYYRHIEKELKACEREFLSVHSIISLSTNYLINNDAYKKADIVHFHMFHNSNYNLYSLKQIANEKKVVISLHDPWFLTGKCVHPYSCDKWKKGCMNCQQLSSLFPMKKDNTSYLWKLKKKIFDELNVDLIVSSKWMKELVEFSKIMSTQKKIHTFSLGVECNIFYDDGNKRNIRKKYNIDEDDIVLFFRSQKEFKGTQYIIAALKILNIQKNIVLISCGEKGLLKELNNKYRIIEFGQVSTDKLLDSYRMCDIFLMPSKVESFGLMAVEAMACERCVVVFDNSALPSVTFAPKCGYLVEDKNSEELMKAIKYLIENPKERNKRGKLGREYVTKYYDINQYNQNLLDLYAKIYNEKNTNINIKNNEDDINIDEVNYLKNRLYIITKKTYGKIPELFESYKQYKNYTNECKIDYSKSYIIKEIEDYNKLHYDYLSILSHKFLYKKTNSVVINRIKNLIIVFVNNPKKFIIRVLKKITHKKKN